MLLILDNYDSFTYNLVHYLEELGAATKVLCNDELTVAEAVALAPERVVISPGPGGPDQAGISCALVDRLAGVIPILGVCLGHQVIAQVCGRAHRAGRRNRARSHDTPCNTTAACCSLVCKIPSSPPATTRWWSSERVCPNACKYRPRAKTGRLWESGTRQWPLEGVPVPSRIDSDHRRQTTTS